MGTSVAGRNGKHNRQYDNKEIYIEDYVLAYLRDVKRQAVDKSVPLVLFGHMGKREDAHVIFIYGAADARGDQGKEEIREKYFSDYDIIGTVTVHGRGRPNENYKIFYEANEGMKDYLICCYKKTGQVPAVPAPPDSEKDMPYAAKKIRQAGKGSIWSRLKVIFMGFLCVLFAVAVSTVNDYEKMRLFVQMLGKALSFMR